MRHRFLHAAFLTLAVAVASRPSSGDELQTFEVTLKGQTFEPSEIHVPSGRPFMVVVKNANDQGDEFEMLFPPVERAVQGGSEAKVRIRPLGPGTFVFFGENDPDNEKGTIVSE
jgi:uncharacterized cupredoxin-like copper-binding protein